MATTQSTSTTETGNTGRGPEWKSIRFEVLERVEQLPSLSSVVTEFLALARRDFFTAKDFEKVISKDQALVARLLKVANSGLYGRSRSINSIPEAVVLIGLENLKKIVFTVSTEGMTQRQLSSYDYHEERGFWLHSMGVGNTSRVLAAAIPNAPLREEEAFVAGLLHDVGKLVIADFLESDRGVPVSEEAEIESVGLDHAELAEYILHQWNLPDTITGAVRYHHDYKAAGAHLGGAAILALAQEICGVWGIGRKNPVDLSEEIPITTCCEILDDLGLPQNKWEQILWEVRQNLVELDSIFDPTFS
jgi:HD-like signal output (HDOD) protein